MGNWYFEPRSGMGGASGAAYRSPLTGTGHTREELISREALQNSTDALLSGETASVDFSFRTVLGAEKTEFLAATMMDEGFFTHAQAQQFAAADAVETFRNPKTPLRLMYIDDWNTKGLGGYPHDDSGAADFFKFCLAIGDADKVDSEGSGGSYGYGKSVFAEASDLRSIFVYSVFEPSEETDGAHARLMGLSWFDKHRLEVPYTGRGFFGKKDPSDDWLVHPLVDDDAHEAARKLGFIERSESDTGLSILVLGTRLSPEKLRSSIETHWWPRLCDNSLDVRLSDEGAELDPPRPMKRPDLAPFITCYRIINGIEEAQSPNQATGKLQRIAELEPGKWAAVAVEEIEADDPSDDGFKNRVALMRLPRMIVEYYPVGRTYRIPIVGVFVADASVDTALKLSEPPAHDRWDPNSSRLTHDRESDQDLVAKILSRLKANIQRFQDSLLPKEETDGDRIRELEKALGSLFSFNDRTPPPPPPPAEKRPVEVRFHERREEEGDLAVCKAVVRLKMREGASTVSDVARISGTFQVLAQDTQNVDGNLKTTISSHPAGSAFEENKGWIRVPIDKSEWQEVEFVSEPFDPDWLVRFSFNAEQANVGG